MLLMWAFLFFKHVEHGPGSQGHKCLESAGIGRIRGVVAVWIYSLTWRSGLCRPASSARLSFKTLTLTVRAVLVAGKLQWHQVQHGGLGHMVSVSSLGVHFGASMGGATARFSGE